jgi:hypothetical protein
VLVAQCIAALGEAADCVPDISYEHEHISEGKGFFLDACVSFSMIHIARTIDKVR